ncbi:reverse transcriptase, putative [Ixodes scapularis]|uniref:Reverse transcriptase, putative n=1 Tax=Ixodes scapularis TaxID=6945 RepID=B7Q306_IXOSC|nr:reverse transcriptase, putative [Ixodes scapularis]|eukprot:XP_002411104.1 reverse transcriptase, putative [Ixodes scapularis]
MSLLNRADKQDGPDALLKLTEFYQAAAFNICLQYRAIPDSWRQSRTILVPKKGDPAEITSWRPISLLRTASKLFSGVLAARLQARLLEYDVLSRTQKGFLPYDGVFEHNYVLQRRMDEARTTSGDLCAAFLDFSNAFGCVPHNAIVDAVRGVGAGEAFAELVQDMYYESSSSVVTNDGCTDPIPMRCGIRQGCPLSGLLFNLVVDPVIRKVQGTTADHCILAYADDLTPLARDPASLQASINLIEEEAGRLGLSLNAAKCRSLHLSGCSPVGLRGSQFLVNGTPIPVIRDFEAFAYLGRPVGFNILQDGSDVDAAIQLGTRILGSMLAPWQRLDAIKTFLYPALHHLMRTGTVGKTDVAATNGAGVWLRQRDLPHVLNHCMRQSQAITQRHNNVVERVKKASAGRFTLVSENAAVGDTQLQLDLVLVRGEEAVVVDVCIPFENRKEALVQARRTKEEKYRPAIDHLRRRYQRVTVEAVVVGALGSWDPANDRFLKKLCSRSYLKRMKQMATSDTIRASRDIYAAHIAGPTR